MSRPFSFSPCLAPARQWSYTVHADRNPHAQRHRFLLAGGETDTEEVSAQTPESTPLVAKRAFIDKSVSPPHNQIHPRRTQHPDHRTVRRSNPVRHSHPVDLNTTVQHPRYRPILPLDAPTRHSSPLQTSRRRRRRSPRNPFSVALQIDRVSTIPTLNTATAPPPRSIGVPVVQWRACWRLNGRAHAEKGLLLAASAQCAKSRSSIPYGVKESCNSLAAMCRMRPASMSISKNLNRNTARPAMLR